MTLRDRARVAFDNTDYDLSVSLFEQCLATMEPTTDLYLEYANALVRCGRLLDSLDVYTVCSSTKTVSTDRLRHLVSAFMDTLTAASEDRKPSECSGLGCGACDGVLVQPVTLTCGHTFCASCVVRGCRCRGCGASVPSKVPDTNVIIKKVVEKWFHAELKAVRLRENGNRLCQANRFEEAVAKYTAAIDIAPSHQAYSNRSQTLYKLNRLQAALTDAEAAIRLRPHWPKAHYRRGVVMSAMGIHEEAFLSFALCVTLDSNSEAMRNDLTRCLKRLLVPNDLGSRRVCVKGRWNFPYFSAAHFLPTVSSSDSEDNSSGEDDYQAQKKSISKVQPNRRLHKIFDRVFQEVARLKKLEHKPITFQMDRKAVDPSEFDCILCCRTLWQPVTTPCGHSYCSMCLDRCLDYSSSCPLCMTSLTNFIGAQTKNITWWLDEVLRIALPETYTLRLMSHQQEIYELGCSAEIPVFVCTTAFPTVPCPLFIYEPRYRVMIRRCIESGTRQFAIVACNPQGRNGKRFADYGTMLKIEDLVLLPDGCSILSTVGTRRFQVLSRSEKDGYNTAQIQFLADIPISELQIKDMQMLHSRVLRKSQRWFTKMPPCLLEEIYQTLGKMPDPEGDWWTLDDGPSWVWWLLAILPLSKSLQIAILSITCLGKRLRAIEKTLDHLALNAGDTIPLGYTTRVPTSSAVS